MFKSVRSRLLFNSLLISLATILAVGMVALLIVNVNFNEQERDYLQSRATILAPTIIEAVAANDRLALQRAVFFSGYSGQVRMQIHDEAGNLIADSGRRNDLLFDPFALDKQELFVGAIMDDSGLVIQFSPPISRLVDEDRGLTLSLLEPSQLLYSPTSFIGISEEKLHLPIRIDDDVVGYLTLSEGPAVGEHITFIIRLALVIGSAVALIIAIIIGLFSANSVTIPLRALGSAVEKMGEDNFVLRAPGSSMQEFNQLAHQFNQMSARLSTAFDRLEKERSILRETITDAGHEIKTPITALKTFNALLLEEVADNKQSQLFVLESEKQIRQLEQISADLLDLSRLEARLTGTNFVITNLCETIEAARGSLQAFSQEKGIHITTELPDSGCEYPHDIQAFQRAIANLLHNAIKYSGEDGRIQIILRETKTELKLSVADNGPGIPEEIQDDIFKRFYRHQAQSEGGSGLGLAICKEIVEIHRGRIWLESRPEQGSTFTITLPIPAEIKGQQS